jgi:hypothetical protein
VRGRRRKKAQNKTTQETGITDAQLSRQRSGLIVITEVCDCAVRASVAVSCQPLESAEESKREKEKVCVRACERE